MNSIHLIGLAWFQSIGRWTIVVLATACSACSTLSLEGARALGASGKDAATKIQRAAFASDVEYSRAMDAEALFHGLPGAASSPVYAQNRALYNEIRKELVKRAVVLAALADFYEAFGDLAAYDAQGETEAALQSLGGSISAYRAAVGATALPAQAVDVISKVGGLISSEIQKKRVREASVIARAQLEAFREALETPLVKKQMLSFKAILAIDRKTAIVELWSKGVFDPSPVIDDMGTDAGLTSSKDAGRILLSDQMLRQQMGEVIAQRLQNKIDALEPAYDASVQILRRLVAEHRKLEDGIPLDIARLRELVAQLQSLVDLLVKPKT